MILEAHGFTARTCNFESTTLGSHMLINRIALTSNNQVCVARATQFVFSKINARTRADRIRIPGEFNSAVGEEETNWIRDGQFLGATQRMQYVTCRAA